MIPTRIHITILILFFLLFINGYSQKVSVLESNENGLKILINFENTYSIRDTVIQNTIFQYISGYDINNENGKPILPEFILQAGIPENAKINLQILSQKTDSYGFKFILPFSDSSKLSYDKSIYGENKYYPNTQCEIRNIFNFRYARVISFKVNPYQFNPITRNLIFTREIIIQLKFSGTREATSSMIDDKLSDEYLKNNVINYNTAKRWISSRPSLLKPEADWLQPNKNYFKIFLKNKGVYRITFDQLAKINPSIINGIDNRDIALFNDAKQIPIEVIDGGDGIFDKGDFIQFVGYPPTPTAYCKQNIYNNENIYWLSYQANVIPKYFRKVDGYPRSWNSDVQTNTTTLHFEKDSIYERLGYAPDDKRDYWFWSKISGSNGAPKEVFNLKFNGLPDFYDYSRIIKIHINMHGITSYSCSPGHRVSISIKNKIIGIAEWDGQDIYDFEKDIRVDSSGLTSGTNYLTITAKGDICGDLKFDEIRLNWCEIEYQRYNRTNGMNYNFSNEPGQIGLIRYWLWQWKSDNMKIYIPAEEKIIVGPQVLNDSDKTILFVDSVYNPKEYFCVSGEYFLTPDSMINTVSSDLRNINNSADYLIITHEKFSAAAKKLAQFHSNNLSGFVNPKVMVVNIQSIYDEFSNGLLDPYAVKNFLKYTLSNWKKPLPSYLVVIGDMSYDYREIDKTSRKNFIPSIPYHVQNYGQAVSDNSIAAISGVDLVPDIAIGRLSCETEDEAEVMVDKIINYPSDASKEWKDNVALIAAGRDTADERRFRFNSESKLLEDNYILPQGYSTEKIFRFPDDIDVQYKGGRLEIYNALNSGVSLANFYGHGGGYQWDDVFYNEDIAQLQNAGKLPFISSITCYTAHFDNQDVFGEKFLKSPGKGCIGFWGSSAITLWTPGIKLNKAFYKQVFTNNEHVVGKAILFADNDFTINDKYDEDMLAVSTYLGDPAQKLALPEKADFSVKSEDIKLLPEIPVTHDKVLLKVRIKNYGRLIKTDSLLVLLTAEYNDTTEVIKLIKLPPFGDIDSLQEEWIPLKEGNVTISVNINFNNKIDEPDYSDNSASKSVFVYNLTEPSVIKPINGFSTSQKHVNFLIADPGIKLHKSFTYNFEIDTSLSFKSPELISSTAHAMHGTARWITPELKKGIYFWRIRVNGDNIPGNWSSTYTFTVQDSLKAGYYVYSSQLKLFTMENAKFSDSLNAIVLDSKLQPPKPSNDNFLFDIQINPIDSIKGITAITTDGTYLYCGQIAYYNGASKIFRIGTGFNGTEKGKNYGTVLNYGVPIKYQMFYHSDGYIYIATGRPYFLLKLNPRTGDTISIKLRTGLLNSSSGKIQDGDYYITSDGKYLYNVAIRDSLGNYNYKIRIIDPGNGWRLVRDIIPQSSGYSGFSGFFIAGNYFYPYENYVSGYMRRINLSTGSFEDEWITSTPFQPYYSWCYDRVNDVVYASIYRQNIKPKLSVFKGYYKSLSGRILTQEIGPAFQWNKLSYIYDPKFKGKISGIIQGLNSKTNKWEDLIQVSEQLQLDYINAKKYSRLRTKFTFSDSSLSKVNSFVLKNFNLEYIPSPEISVTDEDMIFNPDSVLKGEEINIKSKVMNLGYSNADSVSVTLSVNTNPIVKKIVSINHDSTANVDFKLKTGNLPLQTKIGIKAAITSQEFANFNNEADKNLTVYRDNQKPTLKITFNGEEICDGDYISTHPNVVIFINDNRPFIPGDTSGVKIILDGKTLSFQKDSLTSLYRDTALIIRWNPHFAGGIHKIRIFAKDASGIPNDSSGYQVSFLVSDNNNILNVFNYPNPFQNDTYITFNLAGSELPDEIRVRIFTVAGRLIRSFVIPENGLKFGFNKIFYDGRDQDGNSLANGVYFFKLSVRNKNKFLTIINKFAKVK